MAMKKDVFHCWLQTKTSAVTFVLFCVMNSSHAQPLFQLLSSRQTGITFSNTINEDESLNVLSYEYLYNGGGVAAGDLNNDGFQDLVFTANQKPMKAYQNLGGLKFKDITKEAGLEGRKNSWKTGVTMADVNGDGLLDIYVCYSGKLPDEARRNQLFINKGNLKFVDEAKAYGLDDDSYSTQAAFFDFDNDGDLDMFLLNHNVKKIDNMELEKYRHDADPYAGNKLFRNDNGHFTDVSKTAGIYQNPLTFGLGIAIADVNKDGLPDIYVTNDYNEPDYCYINKGNGIFQDDAKNCFRHESQFSMGVDIADFNNDALPDIVTLDMMPSDNHRQKSLQLQESYENFALMQSQDLHKQYMRNMLQLNNGNGTFSEIGQLAGVSETDWSWCPLFADFDNDGYKDLFVTTGYLRDYTNKDFLRYWGDYKIKKAMDREPALLMDLIKAMPVTPFHNCAFKNNGNLTFSDEQKNWGFTQPFLSNGAVYADLDNDGDLDLVVNNINAEASVYKNNSREQNGGNYISIDVKGEKQNTRAIGSKVYVYANGTVQYQEVNPNRGYLSCLPALLNFGIGNSKKIDSIKVIYPDGKTQRLSSVAINQKLKVEPLTQATVTQTNTAKKNTTFFTQAPSIIPYQHQDYTENDFKRQLLMMFMYSKTGPVIAKADVNKDGRDDIFISGDKEKPGTVYLQQANGGFTTSNSIIGDESTSAISAASFFDANGDGYPDLYVAKGGYSLFEANTPSLQDELYINDGKGNFTKDSTALPDVSASSKSCVVPCDYDGDGDMDLFIGGRVIPGQYPLAPKSYLLTNNGKGNFTITSTPFDNSGMVTSAQWADMNSDGKQDLVLCGEWMPVMIFENTSGGFVNKTSSYFDQPQNGFWFSVAVTDINKDGKPDIIAGNLGLNTQIHTSPTQPAELYYADFDNNGSIDPFLNFYIRDSSYPFVSRDELNEQMYSMRKKFTSYKAYADANMHNIFTNEELSKAQKLMATQTETVCYINQNGKMIATALPAEAQFSVVSHILTGDYNKDGHTDLLLLGNHSDNRLKLGSIDANYGCLLTGDGKGGFTYVPQTTSGLSVTGDIKSAVTITISNKNYLVIGANNEPLQFYSLP